MTRIFDILDHYTSNYGFKEDALACKKDGNWVKYSIRQYIESVNQISYGLLKLGIEKGDKIATIANNRPEWNFLDMAILQVGAIHVPIYPNISESAYQFILAHAEVKLVFVSDEDLLRKIEHIVPDTPCIRDVYIMNIVEGKKHLNQLIELGKKNPVPDIVSDLRSKTTSQEIATIIYTSGTTGNPKGVMLTHANILSNVDAVKHIPPVGHEGKALSYLPLCHVYERMLNYLYQFKGISVYYAESMATIADNIREVKPDILTTVPRLLEKIYDKIIANGQKLKGIKKTLFFWALNLGLKFELESANGWWYGLKLKLANKLVFSKWRAALGNNLKVIVSGGAALQPRLSRIFWAAQIPVLEGYGLTETSPVIAVSHFGKDGIKFGTVGPPIKDVEVKIAGDGEILCKGPNVMRGYYKDPERTSKVIDPDGWFHTGDIGILENTGQVRITGRKKEIFKTSFGKYISPELIENKFKESHIIENIVVVGENKQFAAALIVPSFINLKVWCTNHSISFSSDKEMIIHPKVKKIFQEEVGKYNKFFGSYEQIKRFELVPNEFSIESGELTPSLKLKRAVIHDKYKDQINKIFNLENNAN